jgi:hypothetical protein
VFILAERERSGLNPSPAHESLQLTESRRVPHALILMTLPEHPSLSSPADVVAAFFAALLDARWYDAVALVDEKVLAEFHGSVSLAR